MRVLAFDTSSRTASAALVEGGEARASRQTAVARHGKALEPLLREVLEAAGVDLGTVELVAVGLGPGSFTGTRIGVAAAQGLALGIDAPLVGVGSLEALAAAEPGPLVAPVVDAGRGRVYGALYERAGEGAVERLAPFDREPDAALAALVEAAAGEPFALVGSGCALGALAERAEADAAERTPDAIVLARLAVKALAERGPSPPGLEPCYVRGSDAEAPPR